MILKKIVSIFFGLMTIFLIVLLINDFLVDTIYFSDILLATALVTILLFFILWNITKSKLVHLLHIIPVVYISVIIFFSPENSNTTELSPHAQSGIVGEQNEDIFLDEYLTEFEEYFDGHTEIILGLQRIVWNNACCRIELHRGRYGHQVYSLLIHKGYEKNIYIVAGYASLYMIMASNTNSIHEYEDFGYFIRKKEYIRYTVVAQHSHVTPEQADMHLFRIGPYHREWFKIDGLMFFAPYTYFWLQTITFLWLIRDELESLNIKSEIGLWDGELFEFTYEKYGIIELLDTYEKKEAFQEILRITGGHFM